MSTIIEMTLCTCGNHYVSLFTLGSAREVCAGFEPKRRQPMPVLFDEIDVPADLPQVQAAINAYLANGPQLSVSPPYYGKVDPRPSHQRQAIRLDTISEAYQTHSGER